VGTDSGQSKRSAAWFAKGKSKDEVAQTLRKDLAGLRWVEIQQVERQRSEAKHNRVRDSMMELHNQGEGHG